MSFFSIDELIAKLELLKEAGVPGSTQTAYPAPDASGRGGRVQRIEGAGRVSIAKADFEKAQSSCKLVSNRGVDIVLIR